MRITDGTETMEVSVREYGDLSDREITDQTLPSLVEWAETPGIVENVRRTAQRLVELFANDGKNADKVIGRIPDGTKLGLGIRLYAPDIRDDGRGLPDDIRLTRYMRVGRPSPGVVVETELYRLGNVLRGRDLSGLDLRYLDFSGVDLCDVDMSGADLRGSLIDSGTPLGHTVFRDADMRRMRFLGTLKAGRPVGYDASREAPSVCPPARRRPARRKPAPWTTPPYIWRPRNCCGNRSPTRSGQSFHFLSLIVVESHFVVRRPTGYAHERPLRLTVACGHETAYVRQAHPIQA